MLDPPDQLPATTPPNRTVLYVCSSNPGKLRDFASAARYSHREEFVIRPLPGLVEIPAPQENGTSFEQNAEAKALYYSSFTGALVLADDSGLEVDVLGGDPGVHSARYAGPHASDSENNRLLLSNLASSSEREAKFICVLAVAQTGKTLLIAKGAVRGTILTAPQGAGGFGYDPLFFYPPFARSFGQLTPEEKLPISHRGLALRELFERLPGIIGH